MQPAQFEEYAPYVSHVLDDALSPDHTLQDCVPRYTRFVCWQCGFEPLVVAVISYMPRTRVDEEDAVEIATDYLAEIGWFAGDPLEPDIVL